MRKILLLTSTLFSFSLHAQQITSGVNIDSLFRAKEQESVGKAYPQFTAMAGKEAISNATIKGKVVFINFWFEACPPCIAELDALNALYRKFHSNPDFEFLSFTHEKPGMIAPLKRKHHMAYKVASVSDQECYRLNQNNGFPTSIIIDRNGVIVQLFTGGTTDRKKATAFIRNTVYPALEKALKAK